MIYFARSKSSRMHEFAEPDQYAQCARMMSKSQDFHHT